ncbi:hypothetical protein CDAR_555651 [Caerostris darwini]|uniref:Uncharacterized protein n=1 Tax=Caerostris darwini TaxID=1538125 RepID=A0AAV4QUW3_9ARAC|nr:hypothetical protein CDAR_555651 [Caerostris darwini]
MKNENEKSMNSDEATSPIRDFSVNAIATSPGINTILLEHLGLSDSPGRIFIYDTPSCTQNTWQLRLSFQTGISSFFRIVLQDSYRTTPSKVGHGRELIRLWMRTICNPRSV